jgi:hypothetical protein
LTKAIFEKNVTRLDTFARVMSKSREFGVSGHCLVLRQKGDVLVVDVLKVEVQMGRPGSFY